MHFWNLWPKGFQTVYRLSKSADILEEALSQVAIQFFLISFQVTSHWCSLQQLTKYKSSANLSIQVTCTLFVFQVTYHVVRKSNLLGLWKPQLVSMVRFQLSIPHVPCGTCKSVAYQSNQILEQTDKSLSLENCSRPYMLYLLGKQVK